MWTYALLDSQGWTAVVRPPDHRSMLAAGLTEADVEAVKNHLAMLRINDLVPTPPHILGQLMEAADAPLTATNMAQAQSIYFQGMKLALAASDRRYGAMRAEEAEFTAGLLKHRAVA